MKYNSRRKKDKGREISPPAITDHSPIQQQAHEGGDVTVEATDQWSKDAKLIRSWIKMAAQVVRAEKSYPMSDLNWGVLNGLIKDGFCVGKHKNNVGEQTGRVPMQQEENDVDSITTVMALMRPALDASLAVGTKRQKSSLLRYWGIYCAAFHVNMKSFGNIPKGSDD